LFSVTTYEKSNADNDVKSYRLRMMTFATADEPCEPAVVTVTKPSFTPNSVNPTGCMHFLHSCNAGRANGDTIGLDQSVDTKIIIVRIGKRIVAAVSVIGGVNSILVVVWCASRP